jgi:hypothetical protein
MSSKVYVKLEIEEDHLKRLSDLLERDKTHIEDKERIALFYILSGKDSLYQNIDKIYDFENHTIKPECLNDGEWTSEDRKLIALAFNLYNNYRTTPLEVFSGLSKDSFLLALTGIVERVYG